VETLGLSLALYAGLRLLLALALSLGPAMDIS
jgi:hypothetical protein